MTDARIPTTLNPATIVRAWKDPAFARSLPADVQRRLPPNPAGSALVSSFASDAKPGVRHVVGGGYSSECYSTSCYSTSCYSTACYSTECYSTACYSTACYSVDCHTAHCHTTACHTTACHTTACHTTACHTTACHSSACPSSKKLCPGS